MDRSAIWIYLMPPCDIRIFDEHESEFYTVRMGMIIENKKVQALFYRPTLNSVIEDIRIMCDAAEDGFQIFKRQQPTNNSIQDFCEYLKGNLSQATTNSKRILKHILSCIYIFRKITFMPKGTNEFEVIRDKFENFKQSSRAYANDIPQTQILDLPKKCSEDHAPDEMCPASKIVREFFSIRCSALTKNAAEYLTKIEKKSNLLLKKLMPFLKGLVSDIEGSIFDRISHRAKFLDKQKKKISSNEYPHSLIEWHKELAFCASCDSFVRNIAILADTQECLCNENCFLPYILGTIKKWCGNPEKFLNKFYIPDNFFTFDRRLSFCEHLKMKERNAAFGVECSREFRHNESKTIRIQTINPPDSKKTNNVCEIKMIEKSTRNKGFSAYHCGHDFDIMSVATANIKEKGQPYVCLAKDRKQVRYRHLFDRDPAPVNSFCSLIAAG